MEWGGGAEAGGVCERERWIISWLMDDDITMFFLELSL